MRNQLGHGSTPRVSRKAAAALELMVSGASIEEAAAAVPMNPRALKAALNKPHVRSLYDYLLQTRLSGEAGKSIGTLAELRDSAKSEYVRADSATRLLDRAGFKSGAEARPSGPGSAITLTIVTSQEPRRVGGREPVTIEGQYQEVSDDA